MNAIEQTKKVTLPSEQIVACIVLLAKIHTAIQEAKKVFPNLKDHWVYSNCIFVDHPDLPKNGFLVIDDKGNISVNLSTIEQPK